MGQVWTLWWWCCDLLINRESALFVIVLDIYFKIFKRVRQLKILCHFSSPCRPASCRSEFWAVWLFGSPKFGAPLGPGSPKWRLYEDQAPVVLSPSTLKIPFDLRRRRNVNFKLSQKQQKKISKVKQKHLHFLIQLAKLFDVISSIR